jgi:hypothetical protein
MFKASEFEALGNSGGTKISVGIYNGGVFFQGISQESGWIDINFSSSQGKVLHKRLFTPTGSSPLVGESLTDALLREQKRNLGVLVHVMSALLPKEVVDSFEAPTYDAFVKQASSLLGAQRGAEINLKVVPDNKEGKYPDIPSYPGFMEKHISGVQTSLKYSKKELERIAMGATNDAPEETDIFK